MRPGSTKCIRWSVIAAMLAMAGCAEFSSDPTREINDYGRSVKTLVQNSIYDPKKAQNPKAMAPDGMSGQKAAVVLQRAYQADIGSPARVRSVPQLNISGGSSSSGGGGGSSGGSSGSSPP